MYFRRPWGDGWAIRLGSLVAAAESGCPEPDLEVPGVEFRRAKLGFGRSPSGYQLVRVSSRFRSVSFSRVLVGTVAKFCDHTL